MNVCYSVMHKIHNKTLKSMIFLGVFLVSFGCSQDNAVNTNKLTLTGSSTIAPLVLELAKRYEAKHPNIRINVQTGGSSRGMNDARKGLADIGMVSRSLKAHEKDLLAFPIALDGLSIIVHADNNIVRLSRQQVIDIYTGKVTNWSALGGKDVAITVVNKAEGRSTLEVFTDHFALKNSDIKALVIVGDNEQGIKTVAGNPGAIGYVSIGTAQYSVDNNIAIKLLSIDGIAATIANVQQGIFPISRELNLVTTRTPTGLTKAFIEFARSEEVFDIIQQLYFVPVSQQ